MEDMQEKTTAQTIHFGNDEFKWKPFLRQMLIASSSWSMYFSLGLSLGSPTVIIPQMRRNANSTAAVSDEMASWLASAFSYSAIPWVFILPNLVRVFGRKKTIMSVCLTTIASFLVFNFSYTTTHLLISEIIMGITHASVCTINIMIISEYTSPKYRGLFLTIKSASLFWGVWVANTIGTFADWTYIPQFGLVCSLQYLTVFFWPESPHWLASKKRLIECRKAHRWLKGTGENSERELEQMINSQYKSEDFSRSDLKFITTKAFYMPLLLSILAVSQYHFSGKFVFTVYAIDIMKKFMDDERSVYKCMLILDGVTVFSSYVGCVLTKLFKRRTVLLTASGVAIVFLFSMSLYLYLIKLSLVSENIYLSLLFLAGFCLSISCGPMIMATSLYGELIPVKFKCLSIILISLVFVSLHGSLLKMSPLIFKALTMPGTFLFYGLSSLFCAVLMYVYLPETKDKTMLDIELYFQESVEAKKLVK